MSQFLEPALFVGTYGVLCCQRSESLSFAQQPAGILPAVKSNPLILHTQLPGPDI
jgi:hypothetical protein